MAATSTSAGERSVGSGKGFDAQLTLGIPLAQHFLVKLAHAGLGNLVDERPALGYLPPRDLGAKKLLEPGSVDEGGGCTNHGGQRPLAPLVVRDADHGGLEHVGVRAQGVLQI